MTDEKKKQKSDDMDDRFDHLVPLSGSIVAPEVIGDDESLEIRFRIQEIERRVDNDKLELGHLFYRARLNAVYVQWTSPITGKPYQTWEEYVDTESSFGVRSINQMIAMWWWFSELRSFPEIQERIRQVGWTKARVLIGLVDDSNWESWFDLAKDKNKKTLEIHARAAMDKAGVPRRPSIGLGRPNPKGVLPPAIDESSDAAPADQEQAVQRTAKIDTTPTITGPKPAEQVVKSADSVVGVVDDPKPSRDGISVPSAEDVNGYEEKRTRWYALMTEEQKVYLDNAIQAAFDVMKDSVDMTKRSTSDEIGRGLGLEAMATHFLSFYSGSAATNKHLRGRIFLSDIMRGLETSFGVGVVAIDKRTREVLFGNGDSVFTAVERFAGVDLIAIKRGTNEVVHGWDTAASVGQLVGPDEDEGEGT